MNVRPLLIVDVQNGFVNDKSRHVLPVIVELAKHWQATSQPIYMSQFTNFENSQWERLIGWHRLESEEEIALRDELQPFVGSAITFRKRSYSCLVDPFRDDLRANDWSEVVLCGIATDGCVLATAVDLFEFEDRPIRPVVVRDACASHAGEEISNAGLTLIERFIGRGQVVNSSDVLSEA